MDFPKQKQSGTAVVELAVCLPMIFLLIFGSIQACNLIFLKQTATAAAYEGVLAAMKPDATEAGAEAYVDTMLSARNITGATFVIDDGAGADFEDIRHGDPIELTLTVPTAANMVGPPMFNVAASLSVTVSGDKQ